MHQLSAKDFELNWWRIDLSNLRLPKNHGLKTPTAITVNSTTKKESKLIKQWCEDNGVYKLYSKQYWIDHYTTKLDQDTRITLEYSNNERTVLAEESVIVKMEAWLETLPVKQYAILIKDMSAAEIRRYAKGYDVRIITDCTYPELNIVLLDSNMLATELILRCD